jgi:hypothetical protein
VTCPLCGGLDFPHAHDFGVVLNSRHYCPDGSRHNWIPLRWWWFWRRNLCVRCDQWEPR